MACGSLSSDLLDIDYHCIITSISPVAQHHRNSLGVMSIKGCLFFIGSILIDSTSIADCLEQFYWDKIDQCGQILSSISETILFCTERSRAICFVMVKMEEN